MNKCKILAILVISVISLSITNFNPDNAFSQTLNNSKSGTNNTDTDSRTAINLTAVVINSTESMKDDLMKLNQMIQDGDLSNATQTIDKINNTVGTLQVCATSTAGPGYDFP